jgi:hypothetical protein
MTREQAALGQLQDRFMENRMKGFVLRGVPQPPLSEQQAQAAWLAARGRFNAALKNPQLRARLKMDESTPATDNPISGVLSEADLNAIHDQES